MPLASRRGYDGAQCAWMGKARLAEAGRALTYEMLSEYGWLDLTSLLYQQNLPGYRLPYSCQAAQVEAAW